MRIAVVGSFGPSQLAGSYSAGFRSLGHDVHEVHHDLGRIGSRLIGDSLGKLAGRVARVELGRRVLAQMRPVDLVVVCKGAGLDPNCLRRVRDYTPLLVNVFPDDPFNVNGSSSYPHVLETLPLYDTYFVWSRRLVDRVRAAGAPRAEYLAFGTDPAMFHPIDLSEEERARYGAPVSFVGNWDPERERWLEAASTFGLAIWGANWSRARSRNVRAAWRGSDLYGGELLKALSASDIQLNILRAQNKSGHNMRTFEVPATGAFLLTERSPDLELLFRANLEVAAFGTVEELREKLAFFRANPAERARIAAAGRRRALEQTYRHRCQELLDRSGLAGPA